MKSFFFSLFALATLVIPLETHAALYPLSATKSPTSITVTMTGAPAGNTLYALADGTALIASSGTTGESMQKPAVNGSVTWTLTGSALKSTGAYYFTAVTQSTVAGVSVPTPVSETKVVQVNDADPASVVKDFRISPSGDGKVTVSGKIDTAVFELPRLLTVKFEWSKTGTVTGGPTDAQPLTAGTGGQSDIATDGSYAIIVPSLTPGQKYFFKQTVLTSTNAPIETKIDTFTADKGYLIPGSVGEEMDFNSRSYHLLAPLPGLSVLMDPDLCLEKKASGEVPENAICDVNGFLDFAFKLMIGLAAVLLVIRIMIEGYKILTTDVPFIAASAKGNFFTALLGLLLALSAYLILNTINPKLVDNRINIDSVDVAVESFKELGIDYASNETSFGNIGPEGASCGADVKPATINFSGKGYKYIQSDYLPTQNTSIPTAPKGVKTLLTAQAMKEGFWPNTKAWRTNNPGNIGNTDNGSTSGFASLDLGIKRQFKLFNDILQNREPNYKVGRVVKIPGGTGDDGKKYPPINFTFDGSICQYLSIYATAARHNTSYMSLIMGYFKQNGITITPRTKFSEINNMR